MMSNPWVRQMSYARNTLNQSLGALIGIATGLVADKTLEDREIHFLNDWLTTHNHLIFDWPGDILHARVKSILADGVVTDAERAYMLEMLELLVGAADETLAQVGHVTELAFDAAPVIVIPDRTFCFTGDFVYGTRDACEEEVVDRGGVVKKGVSKKVQYVVVGSLGSVEWMHGSFGTKIEKAMQLKQAGADLVVVKEENWVAAL